MTRRLGGLRVFVASVAVASCGSSGPAAPAPSILSVAGTYAVTKAYVDTGCGTALAALTATITVEHAPGASALTVREGLGAYQGTVQSDGRFEATQTVEAHVPPVRMTLREARFTATGLEARNVWEMFGNGLGQPATCTGALSYTGTRTNGTNTFP